MLMFLLKNQVYAMKVCYEIHVTSDFKPQRLKAYKVPELLKPEVARQLQELLDMGFICKSTSAMASPIVCFKGPEWGKWNSAMLRLSLLE